LGLNFVFELIWPKPYIFAKNGNFLLKTFGHTRSRNSPQVETVKRGEER